MKDTAIAETPTPRAVDRKTATTANNTTVDHHRQDGVIETASSAMAAAMKRRLDRERSARTSERERQNLVASMLTDSADIQKLSRAAMAPARAVSAGLRDQVSEIAALEHQVNLFHHLPGHSSMAERISIRGAPYDFTWTDFQPPDARGTQARGPSALTGGSMSLDLIETHVDRDVAYNGWMWAGAAVGFFFTPKSPVTFVRVAPLVDYHYRWRNDSNLQVAHSWCDLGVFIQRVPAPGQIETVIDDRERLWADGTSWFETHEGADDRLWTRHNFFFGSSSDTFLIWVWVNSAIDFSTKAFIGSSSAFVDFRANLKFVVIEQFD